MGVHFGCLPRQPVVALSQASEVAYQAIGSDFFYFINLGELSRAPYSPVHALSELACMFQAGLQASLRLSLCPSVSCAPGAISALPFFSVVGEGVATVSFLSFEDTFSGPPVEEFSAPTPCCMWPLQMGKQPLLDEEEF